MQRVYAHNHVHCCTGQQILLEGDLMYFTVEVFYISYGTGRFTLLSRNRTAKYFRVILDWH